MMNNLDPAKKLLSMLLSDTIATKFDVKRECV